LVNYQGVFRVRGPKESAPRGKSLLYPELRQGDGLGNLQRFGMAATISIEAAYGAATIKTLVLSHQVEEMASSWADRLKDINPYYHRAVTRRLVVDSLIRNREHGDLKEVELVTPGLIWLTVTGIVGERLLPLMIAGDMSIMYEITDISPGRFNFRLILDETTKAALLT